MSNLSQEDWKKKYAVSENAVILDVRTPEEWAEGIIPGAIKINILDPQHFQDEINKLEKEKAYFVYCRSGARSGQACQFMSGLGFNSAFNLMGGILEWDGEIESI